MLIADGKDPKREQELEQDARRVAQRDSLRHIRERFSPNMNAGGAR
jgi:hypothetical protein